MRKSVLCLVATVLVLLTGCTAAVSVASVPTNTAIVPVECTPEPVDTPILIDVTFYQPNDELNGLVALSAQAEDSPQGLLSTLVGLGALPDVGYGTNITFGVADETVSTEDGEFSGVIARLDLSDAFAQAIRLSGAQKEALFLQSLVNTFLVHYDVDAMILTIEGTVLETAYEKYEDPITFDEFAATETN